MTEQSFVGRHRELAALREWLSTSGGSAVVTGEVGIGKTSLVSAAFAGLADKEAAVLRGCCYPSPECGPYFPFFEVLSSLSFLNSPSNVVGSVGESPLDNVNWINLGEDCGERRDRFLRELTGVILGAIGHSKTILLIEDIHWADTGTLLLINALLDVSNSGIQMICTARTDEPVEPDARQLISRIEQKSRLIRLFGLSSSDVRQLLEQLIGSGYITDEETYAVATYTRGNPFFLRELIQHLRANRQLERYSLQEALTRNHAPDSLSHVVDLKLKALPKPLREVLQTSAVLGADLMTERVSRLARLPHGEVSELLRQGVEKHILEPSDGPGFEKYRFAHPLFADRLYETLPERKRRELHRRAAIAIERDGDRESSINDLAHHFALGFGSNGGRRAVQYCQLAAEHAEQIMAFEVAARFWRLAVTCTNTRRTRARLSVRLGWSLWAAGRWEQAVEAWNAAAVDYESLGHLRKLGGISLALGDVHRWRMELDEARSWLRKALASPLRKPDRTRCLALLANTLSLKQEVDEAKVHLEEATRLWSEVDCDPIVAFWLSHAYLMIGNPSKSLSILIEGLERATKGSNPRAMTFLTTSLASHYLCTLDVEAARSHIMRAEQALDPGDVTNLQQLWSTKVYLLSYLGQWKELLETCENWMARARLAGRYQTAFARLVWAEAQFALGHLSEAEKAALRALEDLGDMTPVGAIHLARMLLKLGRADEAEQLARTYASSVCTTPRYAFVRGVLGDVLSKLNTPDLWQDCYDSLRRERRAMLLTACPTSVPRVLGGLATRLGMWQPAIEHYDRAIRELESGQAHWELANAYADYARMRTRRRRRGDMTKALAMRVRAESALDELGLDRASLRFESESASDGNRYGLTGREIEVLVLLSEGRRNREIAEKLTLSLRTVERHLENIIGKMGLKTRTEVILRAVQEGLVGPFASASGRDKKGRPRVFRAD